ncbi:MAG: hypothetical protein WBN22_01020 [Verrucomicrobiia bacterium]
MKLFEVKAWSEDFFVWQQMILSTSSADALNAAGGILRQRTFSGPVTLRCKHNPEAFFRAR